MKCRICKRPLKNPVYIRMGIGPVCSKRVNGPIVGKAESADQDQIIPYDGGDFFIERLPVIRGNLHSLQTDAASGIITNVKRSIYKHSPTGYNFGYGGSGPADFALNLLMMVTTAAEAQQFYQKFKFQFVATNGENEKLVIPKEKVKCFCIENQISFIE